MPLVKKLMEKLSSDEVDSFGGLITEKLTQRYPDIDKVLETFSEMKEQYRDTADCGPSDQCDSKWRPKPLTLGLLYKLQRINDSNPQSWYNQEHIFIHDGVEELKLLKTFAFYWHYCVKIAKSLRSIHNKGGGHSLDEDGNLVSNEDTFNNVAGFTSLERKNILFAHATDSLHVNEHCPDFAIVILHDLKQVLIVICGTRMIPNPKTKDVFMDLYADATEFLHGVGHKGMVIGAKNIVRNTINKVSKTLQENPGYNIMVIGYSLGAGICQLVTMELLEGESRQSIPPGTNIRCISYGAPPIFKSSHDDYKCSNIFSVVYYNDGLASVSTSSVTKLFMQIRAIDKLQLRRRDIIKLLYRPIPLQGGGELNDDNDEEEDDYTNKKGSVKIALAFDKGSDWCRIKEAVEGVPDCGMDPLEHPAKQLFMFKRKESDIITRKLTQTKELSDHLRLRAAMFNHHMPWSYNALFEGHGLSAAEVDLDILKITSTPAASLYPDLSEFVRLMQEH